MFTTGIRRALRFCCERASLAPSRGALIRRGLAADGVHFSIVLLLAYATRGANMHARGGYPLTIVVGLLFGAGAVAAILWLRASAPTRSERLTGALGVAFIWFAFTETHAGRALQSPIFTIPTSYIGATACSASTHTVARQEM